MIRWRRCASHFFFFAEKPMRGGASMGKAVVEQLIVGDYTYTDLHRFVRWWDFRDIYFWDTNDDKNNPDYIDGTVFRSSLKENGKNVALFKGPEISLKNEAQRLVRG
jgi:hypothetical protein